MDKTAVLRRMCVLAATIVLSGCARNATPSQLEPTRTVAVRPTATERPAAEPTPSVEATAASASGLRRGNVAALSERFVRRERLPRGLYAIAAERIGAYSRGAFETFDARTLKSIRVTNVELDAESSLHWYALSIDARRGVIMSQDGSVDVYDLEAGRRVNRFEIGVVNRMTAADIALDATGKSAVVIANGKLTRYDTATGEVQENEQEVPSYVVFVYFARDASKVALIDARGGIEVRDTVDGSKVNILREIEQMQRISFSPDGRRLATANDKSVQIWDVRSGEEIWGVGDLDEAVSVAFPAEGDVVALHGRAGGAVLYDIEKRDAVEEFEIAGGGLIDAVEFSTDGESIFVQGGSIIERIELNTMRSAAVMRRFAVTQGQWTASGDLLAWSDRYESGEVLVLNAQDGSTRHVLQHDVPLRRMLPARSGRFVATGTVDESVYVWDVVSGERLAAIEEESSRRLLLCIDPQEESVVYFEDGAIVSTPFEGVAEKREFQPPSEGLLDVSYCDNAAGLLAFQDSRTIELMNLKGRTVATIDLGMVLTRGIEVDVSADGRWVGGLLDDEFVVWDAKTGARAASRRLSENHERAQFMLHPRAPLAMLRDGLEYFVVNIESGKAVKLDVPEDDVLKIGFPRDESLLTATSRVIDQESPFVGDDLNFTSGALTVWDVETGKVLRREELDDPVYSSVLSEDGAKYAVFGYDGSLTMWTVE